MQGCAKPTAMQGQGCQGLNAKLEAMNPPAGSSAVHEPPDYVGDSAGQVRAWGS